MNTLPLTRTPRDALACRVAPPLAGALHAGQWLVTVSLVAFLVIPVVMSVLAGLSTNYFRGISAGLTLHWLGVVWQAYSGSVWLSLEIALATVAITLLAGVPAAYALARSSSRTSRVIEELLVLPVALPGLATALALLSVYGGFSAFRSSSSFIVAGHVVFTLPFMVRSVAAVCAGLDLKTLEESAASLGATFWRRFFTIVLPNVRPGIVAGALTVLTLSIGEFNLTWMLHTPHTQTLPVGLANAYASMRLEIGSAYTILFLAMAMPLLIAMQWFGVDVNGKRAAPTFRGQRVLEPLDLAIGAAETLVLLGPSGCGKTTTLRLIAGLERPDAGGTVRFGDNDVTALPIERRQVGMVFQNYALFPNLTVRGNIGYGLRIRRFDAATIRRRVDELLAMTELSAHADKPISQLSGGQRQRVALARALAPQPRVLLLDEPLTALDARLRETLRDDMHALLQELNVTSIYVTHDQAEAMALADRIVVMSAGRIEQCGTPRDIYYRPANRTVAQFIGTLNRVTGVKRNDALLAQGGVIAAANAGGPLPGPDGAAIELFFRPEDAQLVDPCSAAPLRGRVESLQFQGERTRVKISDATVDKLVVDVPGRVQLCAGAAVGIAVRADKRKNLAGEVLMLLAQITDLHIKRVGALAYRRVDTAACLSRCVERLNALVPRPDAVLVTGDLTDLGTEDEYRHLAQRLAPLAMPVYLMIGNHDSRDALLTVFDDDYLHVGNPFVQYTVDVGAVRIIALDSKQPRQNAGTLCDARLEWLEQQLDAARDRPVVIALHHPPFDTGIGYMDNIGLEPHSRARLSALVSAHPNVERILCGHLHRSVHVRFAGTIASSTSSIAHQVVLNVSENAPSELIMEPAAFTLHRWTPATGLVSHHAYIDAFGGPFEGPYPGVQID
ncbi:hypothetical protein DFQ28_004643 [Apophysomyces sp. BC1034]|nr:hypothetical protein DFQ28_004643 [Apophysomyces sp. BC1034]